MGMLSVSSGAKEMNCNRCGGTLFYEWDVHIGKQYLDCLDYGAEFNLDGLPQTRLPTAKEKGRASNTTQIIGLSRSVRHRDLTTHH